MSVCQCGASWPELRFTFCGERTPEEGTKLGKVGLCGGGHNHPGKEGVLGQWGWGSQGVTAWSSEEGSVREKAGSHH